MPFFLIPLAIAAKAVFVHLGAAAAHSAAVHTAATAIAHSAAVHGAATTAAHQAVVAGAAHIPTHSLLCMGGHIAQTQVLPAAVAAGSVIGGLKIIGGAALSGIVFLGAVSKYRAMHHLDVDGQRKMEFRDIEPCGVSGCGCSDFSLAKRKFGKGKCICGHAWHDHPKGDVDAMRKEGKAYVESVGKSAFQGALTDFGLN
jgi:hypothetical protein